MELTLKVIDDNKVVRVFAGMPELETLYYRCPQWAMRHGFGASHWRVG
jgi:hypothetical protein